jgi:hypothetical protein
MKSHQSTGPEAERGRWVKCRAASVPKLDAFKGRMALIPGATNDREVIRQPVAGCEGVLTVLAPWGVQQYSTGTAQAVLDFAAWSSDCGRSDSPSAHSDVPSRLQIDHRHHRPEVSLDAGQQLRRIDFLAHETLPAHAELDARLV